MNKIIFFIWFASMLSPAIAHSGGAGVDLTRDWWARSKQNTMKYSLWLQNQYKVVENNSQDKNKVTQNFDYNLKSYYPGSYWNRFAGRLEIKDENRTIYFSNTFSISKEIVKDDFMTETLDYGLNNYLVQYGENRISISGLNSEPRISSAYIPSIEASAKILKEKYNLKNAIKAGLFVIHSGAVNPTQKVLSDAYYLTSSSTPDDLHSFAQKVVSDSDYRDQLLAEITNYYATATTSTSTPTQ